MNMILIRTLCVSSIYLTLIISNASCGTCPSNCQCSNINDAALCCMLPTSSKILLTDILTDQCKNIVSKNGSSDKDCDKSWNVLSLQLTPKSWPLTINKLPYNPDVCTKSLEKIVIVGTSSTDPDDRLKILKAEELLQLFSSNIASLPVKKISIQRTELHIIENGFLDRFKARNVNEVEFRYNPHLKTFGVGWLSKIFELTHLDLQSNSLKEINLAKWGIPSDSSQLYFINFSGNQIKLISPNEFDRVPKLLNLQLDDNNIQSLDSKMFSRNRNLRILSLKRNDLRLAKLTGDLTETGLNSLSQLYLSKNKNFFISDITGVAQWWLSNGCPKNLSTVELRDINLDDDSAKMLVINVSGCPSLSVIDLTENEHLTCIPHSMFGLPSNAENFPNKFPVIRPENLKLCNPVDFRSSVSNHTQPASLIISTISENSTKKRPISPTENVSLLAKNSSLSYGQFLIILALLCIALIIIVIITIGIFLFIRSRQKRFGGACNRHLASPNISLDKNHEQYRIIPQGAHILYDQHNAYLACPPLMTKADLMCATLYPRNKSPTSDTTLNAGDLPEDLTPMTNKDDTNSSSLNDSGFAQQTSSSCYAAPIYPHQRISSMVASASSYFPSTTTAGPFETIYVPTRLGNINMVRRPESYCPQGLSSSCTVFPSMMSLNSQPNRNISPPIGIIPIGASTLRNDTFIPVSNPQYRFPNGRSQIPPYFRHSFILPTTFHPTEPDRMTPNLTDTIHPSPNADMTYQSASNENSTD